MARRKFTVVVPEQPDNMNNLGNDILSKHDADGAASPIPAATASLLREKLDEGDAQFTLQKSLDKEKKRINEERNLILGLHDTQTSASPGTVLFMLTSIRDFLLGRYRGSERKLGDWGFKVTMPKGAVKVEIPRNPDKLTRLAADVLKKHEADKDSSPLAVFDMAGLKSLHADADKKLTEAAAISRSKEKATQARNLALGTDRAQTSKTPNTVSYIVRSVRDILLGIYRGQEQQLGDWGFEVNFSTASKGGSEPTPSPGG